MKKLLTAAFVLISASALAQGVRFDGNVTQTATNVPAGAAANIMTVPNAIVTVCSYPAVGSPCTNTIPIYSDQALTQVIDNPLRADPKGRYGFWITAGTYDYSVQNQAGTFVGTYALTLLVSGGGGAGNPAPPALAVQFANSAVDSFQGDTTPGYNTSSAFNYNPTTHALGSRIVNSLAYPSQYQTGAGGNGITNYFSAFPAANQTLFVDPGDAGEFVNPSLLPVGSMVNYLRAGAWGFYSHNCLSQGTFAPTLDSLTACSVNDIFIDSAVPTITGAVTMNSVLASGPGFSGDYASPLGSPWTVTGGGLDLNISSFRPSITNGLTVSVDHLADGDNNGINLFMNQIGGVTAGSDQGLTGYQGQFTTSGMSVLRVGTTSGTGDTTVQPAPFAGTTDYSRIYSGLIDWLLDYSKGGASSVTGAFADPGNYGSGLTPGTYTVPCTGGGGSGATLTVIVEAGAHSLQLTPGDVTVASGGSGYTSAPTCTLTAAGGTSPTINTTVAIANTVTASGSPVPGSSYLEMLPMGTANLTPITGDVVTTSGVAGNSNPGHYTTDTITAVVQNNHPLVAGLIWNTGGNVAGNSSLPERDNVVSVSGGTTTGSTQTIVLQHVSSVNIGANFYQGGTQGCLSFDYNFDYTAIFGCYFAYGAYDSSHLIYGNLSHGSQNGNFLPSPGDMPAGFSPPTNGIHVYLGTPVLYTNPTIAGDAGSIGGSPVTQQNSVPWAVPDVLIDAMPSVYNVTGGMALNFTSNVPANGQGDNLMFLEVNGSHWTGETNLLEALNTESPTFYTSGGGPLNSPHGITFAGPWTNYFTAGVPPSSGEYMLGIQNDGTVNNFYLFKGTQQILVNNGSNSMLFSGSIATGANSSVTTSSVELTHAFGNQNLGIGISPANVPYTELNGATGNNNGTFSTGQLVGAAVNVGGEASGYSIANFPTGSGTAYAWSVGCTDVLGGVTVPITGSTGSGPTSLSGSNFYQLNITPGIGCVTATLYRVAGPGGVGAICTVAPFSLCRDTGQTASGAIPTVGTSGKILFSDSAVWSSGQGAPSGACTNGSMYTSTTGTTVNILWACGGSAWVLVK